MIEHLSKSNSNIHKISEFTEIPSLLKREQHNLQERASLSVDEILEIEQTAEFLGEQVETLQQELQSERQLVEEYHQELLQTNYEMSVINRELQDKCKFKKLKLDEAKLLALNILSTQKSTSESLADLLSAIYRVSVTADQLGQVYVSGESPGGEPDVVNVD